MKQLPALVCCCFLAFTPVLLLAQDSTAQAQNGAAALNPVTVTASLSPEKASKTGRNIFVIQGEKLAHLPVHSIDELLRYIPGVEVQARGPMGSQSDIVIRGGTFQQVLVILDGVRVNDPNTGHFNSYLPVVPTDIERIEVLKGASSAIYGSEAVGGVINIITKAFAARHGVNQSSVQAQATAGAYNLLNASVGGFFNYGKTAISVGALSNNASGAQQRGTTGFFHNHTASVALHRFLNNGWQLALRSAYDNRKFAAQNFYTSFASDTAQEQVTAFWNQMQVTHRTAANTLRFNGGLKLLNDTYAFNPSSIANQSKSRLVQFSITDEIKIKELTAITIGTQYINKKISSNDRGNHNLSQAALFAILNQQIDENFNVAPALRLEWNQQSGWEVVPQVNVSYNTSKLQLRASAGKTIRDADFTERYNNYNKTVVTSGRIGNPNLTAERSFSYEAGTDYIVFTSFKISGTFFQRYHSRLIDYATTPYEEMPRKDNLVPGGSYALAKNIARVTTTGAEIELQYTKNLSPKQQLWGSVGLVWLNSKSSDAAPFLYITSHAKHLTNFNIQYSNPRIVFSINGLYKHRQPQNTGSAIAKLNASYFVVNSRAEVFLLRRQFSVFAEADNLFNENYADLLGAQMPGRWIMGGIKISLSK